MKILFVFGAGASCGADIVTKNPPLGNKLFDELVQFSPEHWGGINDHLSRVFRSDFEIGTQLLPVFYQDRIIDLHKEMARFFFQFELSPGNLYCQLIQRFKRGNSNVQFSTLNYERLLELAMIMNNISYNITYPHGCCHLLSTNTIIIANHVIIGNLGHDCIGGANIEPVHDKKYFKHYLDDLSVMPVMSFFEPQKRTAMIGNSFLEHQRQLFKQQCKDADLIIVVGIQYREHDKHIWDSLGETKAKVIYCSGRVITDNFKAWVDSHNGRHEILYGYFRDKFDDICNLVGI